MSNLGEDFPVSIYEEVSMIHSAVAEAAIDALARGVDYEDMGEDFAFREQVAGVFDDRLIIASGGDLSPTRREIARNKKAAEKAEAEGISFDEARKKMRGETIRSIVEDHLAQIGEIQ